MRRLLPSLFTNLAPALIVAGFSAAAAAGDCSSAAPVLEQLKAHENYSWSRPVTAGSRTRCSRCSRSAS